MRPREVFVGRDALIEELSSSLSPDGVFIGDTFGIYGIGKSALLERLRAIMPQRGTEPCVVLRHDLVDFNPQTSGAELTVAALSRTHKHLCQLLGSAADQLGEHGSFERNRAGVFGRVLRTALKEHTKLSISIKQDLTLGRHRIGDARAQNIDIEVSEASLRNALEMSHVALVREFAAMVNDVSASRRVLWTLDSFDEVAGQELGRWIVSLLTSLRNTLVVLARTQRAGATMLHPDAVAYPISRLRRAEVTAFLLDCLPGPAVTGELVDVVLDFTAGHPLTVAMVADLHQSVDESRRSPREFKELLDELPAETVEAHADLALRIVRAAAVDDYEPVLEACAVAHVFDADKLAAVVGDDVGTPLRDLLRTLRQLTFVEELEDRGSPAYRLHGFIANALRQRLLRDDPARFRELQRRAAAHHFEWLNQYEEHRPQSSYAGWYRYEDPVWLAHERAWLHHDRNVVRALPAGPEKAAYAQELRVRFLRVFVDAFWWWGCYIEFAFMGELIDDWEATQEDDSWLDDLRDLLANYPTGYRKQRRGEVWETVEDALLALLESCGLDAEPDELGDENRRHTRALVEIFLAHAHRHREVAAGDREATYRQALSHYEAARALLERDEDVWNLARLLFERAELQLEFGRHDAAGGDWSAAAALAAGPELQFDEELKANLHRLRADMHSAAGERTAALRSHGRAIAHAYLFQNRPHEPDSYTAAFYREMLDRALPLLRGAVADRAEAEAAAALRGPLGLDGVDVEQLRTALAGDQAEEATQLLFPAPPGEEELLVEDSPFVRRWRRATRPVSAELSRDLATTAP